MDEEELRSLAELLLDECECALGPDCLPARASFSSRLSQKEIAVFAAHNRVTNRS
jgi:hypothetical protein